MKRMVRGAMAAMVAVGLALSGAAAANAAEAWGKTFNLNSTWRITISSTASGTVKHFVDKQAAKQFENGANMRSQGSTHTGGIKAFVSATNKIQTASASSYCPTGSCPI